jgi:hypothetical protein
MAERGPAARAETPQRWRRCSGELRRGRTSRTRPESFSRMRAVGLGAQLGPLGRAVEGWMKGSV